jgi:argininosuccinate lyase
MKKKAWSGRFEKELDKLAEDYSESVSFDARLAPYDIRGSIAHVKMLAHTGVLKAGEAKRIVAGLNSIARDVESGKFKFKVQYEDVHLNIERALIMRIGDVGGKVHTARSRNDQVMLDVLMYLRDQVDDVQRLIMELQEVLVGLAEATLDVVIPGFTHMQHAQPVLLAHHFLAYFEMFQRDRSRFAQLRKRVNVMPLGSAALAGTSFPIDREYVARELGFDSVADNSIDAVSDRDCVVEFCSAASICMMHLSRLAEELILWSTSEFGFIELDEAFTTGSSIMPQKKNADIAELARAKTGRVYGNLIALLTVMKGLPLAYNRDLQEDKEPLFDTADTLTRTLAVMAPMLGTLTINRERIDQACREGYMNATELADYLARKGVPFREAHRIVGKIVLDCAREKRALDELSLKELRKYSKEFADDALTCLSLESAVNNKTSYGGTSPIRVHEAIRKARRTLRKKYSKSF